MAVIKYIILFMLFVSHASAETYVGLGVGHGTSTSRALDDSTINRVYFNDWKTPAGSNLQLFIGKKYRRINAEFGFLHLPTYYAFSEALNPSRSTSQSIEAESVYFRVSSSVRVKRARFYAFIGPAYTVGKNHEFGIRDGINVEHKNTTRWFSAYYGAGFTLPASKKVRAYAEYGVLPGAVKSYWTNDRTYKIGTTGLSIAY